MKILPLGFSVLATLLNATLVLMLVFIPGDSQAQERRMMRDVKPIGTPRAMLKEEPAAPKIELTAVNTATAVKPVDQPAIAKEDSKETNAKNDSNSATDLAWTYFDKKEWEKAEEWFKLALEWNSSNLLAAEGLVMSKFESGDALSAYGVARDLDDKIPGLRKLIVESTNKRAEALLRDGKVAEARALITGFPSDESGFANTYAKVEQAADTGVLQLATVYGGPDGAKVLELPDVETAEMLKLAENARDDGRYHVSQWYLEQAEAREELPRSYEMMKAWNFYHSRQFAVGATLFEKLYRDEEDVESAEGLAFCLQQAQDFETLTKLSEELGGQLHATATPVIQSAKKARARELAQNPNMLVEGEDLPLPQYAPTAALEAAGEKHAIVKPSAESLQANR